MKYLINSYRKLGQAEMVKIWYTLWKNLKTEQWKELYYGIANSFTNEPQICVKWSKYTFENYYAELSTEETKQVYALIVNNYKKLNKQNLSQFWFNEWKKFMRGEQK